MDEGKYGRAPPIPHELYTMADCGENSGAVSTAADLDFDDNMVFLYVDGRASERRARIGGIGGKVEEDRRERGDGEDKRRERQAANDLARLKRARSTLAARKFRANRQKATEFRRDKTSVAERLLAAWTTVEPVMLGGDGGVGDAGNKGIATALISTTVGCESLDLKLGCF